MINSRHRRPASPSLSADRPCIHFVTGRLAEHSLRQVLERLAPRAGFDWTVQAMPITVAAG